MIDLEKLFNEFKLNKKYYHYHFLYYKDLNFLKFKGRNNYFIILFDNQIRFYKYIQIHREDGPAIIYKDENIPNEYYLYDRVYLHIKSDEEWLIKQLIE